MSEAQTIQVEVAYALPERQAILPVQLAAGGTALDAVRQSGIAEEFEGLNIDNARLGLFGKVISPGQVLHEGDRVEIYRPLIADPKLVRKERAARAREKRSADKQGESGG
jgi:putative ubiquitin-RnfH superfamily antitoxin RatB of RatAB toxin-antitoxin module